MLEYPGEQAHVFADNTFNSCAWDFSVDKRLFADEMTIVYLKCLPMSYYSRINNIPYAVN